MDFPYPFKGCFAGESVRKTALTAYKASLARMLESSHSFFLKKPNDYVQCLIDDLTWIHFTACHTGAIVSQETARKASFTREREAAKEAKELRAGMVKVCKEMDELNKIITSEENKSSSGRYPDHGGSG